MAKRLVFAFCIVLACGMLAGCATTGEASENSGSGNAATSDSANIDMAYVKEHAASAKLLDVRDFVDYAGKLNDDEDRNGHVPGAINVPYSNMLDKKTGEPISEVRLTRMFNHANLVPEDEIIVYGAGSEDAQAVVGFLSQCGFSRAVAWTEGYGVWMNDPANEIEKSSLSCCVAD